MTILLRHNINFNWKDIVVLGLVASAIFCAARNLRKLRPWVLVLSVSIAFIFYNYSLTYSNFVNLLTGQLPIFIERPIWYVLVLGIVVITSIWGRNFYCSWLCPFGAVQEGAYKSLNLYNFSPSHGIRNKAAKLRWPMLWLAAMLALIANNAGITGYEPFSVFFDGNGNRAQWIIMISVLVVSMAQLRFWCNYFCPVGTILNFLAQIKRRFRKNRIESNPQALSGYSLCLTL
ncbi:4Fe-4S binding protein [Syntrophomonas curvata]